MRRYLGDIILADDLIGYQHRIILPHGNATLRILQVEFPVADSIHLFPFLCREHAAAERAVEGIGIRIDPVHLPDALGFLSIIREEAVGMPPVCLKAAY